MRAVNLLQEDGRRGADGQQGPLTPNMVLAGGAGLVVAAVVFLGFLFIQGRNHVSDKRATLQSVQQQVAVAQAKAQKAAEAATSASPTDAEARLAAFTTAASARISWDTLMFDLARVLPPGSWVSGLTMHAPTSPASAAAAAASTPAAAPAATPTTTAPTGDSTTFVISGFALSNNTVARVMERLGLVPMLSDVSLQSSTRTTVGAHTAFQFSMNAVLQSAGVDQ